MKNRGGFSDTTPPMNPEERPRRLAVATDPESFPCEADGCNKTFPTKRCLGVHQQKVHRDWYDAAQMARRPPKKVRWTDEELSIVAEEEAKESPKKPTQEREIPRPNLTKKLLPALSRPYTTNGPVQLSWSPQRHSQRRHTPPQGNNHYNSGPCGHTHGHQPHHPESGCYWAQRQRFNHQDPPCHRPPRHLS
ncbi:hypothetical protein CBL_12030 [Carabus blaptoides fortunei]